MCNRYAANPNIDLNPFTMLLNGVIDAAVMGGISNYEKVAFLLCMFTLTVTTFCFNKKY